MLVWCKTVETNVVDLEIVLSIVNPS